MTEQEKRYDEVLALHDAYAPEINAHAILLSRFGVEPPATLDDFDKATKGRKLTPAQELILSEVYDSFTLLELMEISALDVSAVWSIIKSQKGWL